MIQEIEVRIAALELLVGKQASDLEFPSRLSKAHCGSKGSRSTVTVVEGCWSVSIARPITDPCGLCSGARASLSIRVSACDKDCTPNNGGGHRLASGQLPTDLAGARDDRSALFW